MNDPEVVARDYLSSPRQEHSMRVYLAYSALLVSILFASALLWIRMPKDAPHAAPENAERTGRTSRRPGDAESACNGRVGGRGEGSGVRGTYIFLPRNTSAILRLQL